MLKLLQKKSSIYLLLIFTISAVILLQPMSAIEKNPVSTLLPSTLDIKTFKINPPPNTTHLSFEQYKTIHPYSEAHFHNKIRSLSTTNQLKTISILIESTLYTKEIEEKINRYITDLEIQNYSIQTLTTISGGNPIEVKQWVKQQYNQGVNGAIFIGNIPVAWAEVSEATFPCDLFYMDIDGLWTDADNDGIYEDHVAGSGDMSPELFIGRFYLSSLNWDNQEFLLKDYFDKIHLYNIGELSLPWHGLEYIDEDWYNMDVCLTNIFDENISHHDFGYDTTGQGYLDELNKEHQFVTVCAHSYSGGHHFSKRPTEAVTYAHSYVYSPMKREAKLLIGCDDGIIIWLNGENILEKDRYNRWILDQFKIDITLNKGWNKLLCKISQESGDYQLSVRITDKSYNNIPDLTYQLNNPAYSQGEAEFIRSWLLHGFHQDSPDNFYEYLNKNYLGTDESSHIPFEGETLNGKTWTIYKSEAPYIDLNAYNSEADYGVTYCYATINSDQDIQCELWMGYDDGMKAWLNQENIIVDNRYGGYSPDMIKIPVQLNKGENHLLLKISEWMGSNGFSARFCTSTGEAIEGLEYFPAMSPISYIGTWLILGPYPNENQETRLTTSYIPDETQITPSRDEHIGEYVWATAYGSGKPFDIGSFFDHGDWVYSQDIQTADPPAFFYNLFACSAGYLVDENYIAASYIFNTSYGLACLASSKSGSMLYFNDFTKPLSIGKSIGESFLDWFDCQAPYAQWEKEWYYGMMLFGDPTLSLRPPSPSSLTINLVSPTNGIYAGHHLLFPFFTPVIIGDIKIQADIKDPGDGIKHVSFYIDENLCEIDEEYPYEYHFNESLFGKHTIRAIAEDISYHIDDDVITIWKIF